MRLIKAKQILSSWSSGNHWFGCNYNMNIYKGCSHGCIYCDSRSECYQVDHFEEVRGKENCLMILDNELKSKRNKGIVGTGAMSDPYNPFEKEYQLTRGALELINKYQYGVGILTKSTLVLRDVDLLKKIRTHSEAMVNFTITTYDDNLCKLIEPHVSLSSDRFKAVKELSNEGIFTGVLIWPILPFINDNEDNIRKLVQKASDCGASFVIPSFGVTLRQNQRDYYYDKLDLHFPGLKQRYKHVFGNQYECLSPNHSNLWNVFKQECNKVGLPYKMSDIVSKLRKTKRIKQLSLFDE
ncbi:radical SAM protein [Mycoplasmatota bacterium]|nr:radical SAM protein [Mycoplasmatota bacterium]